MERSLSQLRLILLRDKLILGLFLYGISVMSCLGQENEDITRLEATVEVASNRIDNEGYKSEYLKVRGWAYYQLKDFDKALGDFTLALEIDSSDCDLYVRRADIEFDVGDYENSIRDYSKAIKLSPDSLSYLISRGVAYEKVENYESALKDYTYVLQRSPNNELALKNRAILYSRTLTEYDKGMLDWTKLIEISKNPSYYNDRGLVLLEKGLYKESVRDFTDAIKLDSKIARYFFNRGFSYGMLGEIKKAFNDFAKAQELEPDNPYLYKSRGEIFLRIGKLEDACKDFNEAKRLELDVEELLKKCSKIK